MYHLSTCTQPPAAEVIYYIVESRHGRAPHTPNMSLLENVAHVAQAPTIRALLAHVPADVEMVKVYPANDKAFNALSFPLLNERPSHDREIRYDCKSRDYAMYLDGELVGFARSYQEAESTLDTLVFELLHGQYFAQPATEMAAQ